MPVAEVAVPATLPPPVRRARVARTQAENGKQRAPRKGATGTAVAALAHELRTPISTLRVSLELLEEYPRYVPPRAGRRAAFEKLLNQLQRTTVWLEAMVENMTSWSQVETGRFVLERRPVAIADCVADAVAVVQPLLHSRRQQLEVTCPQPSPRVEGDQRRLDQVLINLLTNASAYSPAGEPIAISVAQQGAEVLVEVTDRGPGVATTERRRVFTRYTRSTAGASRPSGLGLGLHIVRTTVQLHGGRVGVRKSSQGGATFWFALPQHAFASDEYPADVEHDDSPLPSEAVTPNPTNGRGRAPGIGISPLADAAAPATSATL